MATKSEEAYKKILKLLLQRHFGDAGRFSVRELAGILDMSVVPVSEAIRRLQQQGLVLCQPRKKLRVRTLSSREFRDVMVVREGLECQAVSILARLAGPSVLSDLKAKSEKIDDAIQQGEFDILPRLDFEFHTALARAAKCKLLVDKIEELAILTLICSDPKRINHSSDLGTHARVVEALASGDPALAEQAMRNQLKGIVKYAETLRPA